MACYLLIVGVLVESNVLLDVNFVRKLESAEAFFGMPFVISSGFRSEAVNRSVDGVADSAHLSGLAVDIVCRNSLSRFKIVRALLMVGFCRIGLDKDHIHVDDSKILPQNVLWFE